VWLGCIAHRGMQLCEILAKRCEVALTADEQRAIAEQGSSYTAPCLVRWTEALTREDGMVDTFAALYPMHRERFTCWDQYTNRRCMPRPARHGTARACSDAQYAWLYTRRRACQFCGQISWARHTHCTDNVESCAV
jgi:hypothetical protein